MHASQYSVEDTIVAAASTTGGLRGVVRISGKKMWDVLAGLFGESIGSLRQRDHAFAASLELPSALGPLPCRVHLWPTPASYTRQLACELHVSGSSPVMDEVVGLACRAGARLAQPGEFTLRAFLAGRLDLLQAEGVLALVEARTRPQMDSALLQLAGGVSQPLQELRSSLLGALAEVEAGLDFVEEDIEFISSEHLSGVLQVALGKVDDLLRQLDRRAAAEIPTVVLHGPPNAGKSSLLNALCGDASAIVSAEPGTTRDYVETTVCWQGQRVRLIDTAGLDAASVDAVDRQAQRRALDAIETSHLRLWCWDATRRPPPSQQEAGPRTLLVWTKSDLMHDSERLTTAQGGVAVSSAAGHGLDELRGWICARLAEDLCTEALAASVQRCRTQLEQARDSLARANALTAQAGGDELVAAELRTALKAVGQLVGEVHTDDLLDQIFTRFCIGK